MYIPCFFSKMFKPLTCKIREDIIKSQLDLILKLSYNSKLENTVISRDIMNLKENERIDDLEYNNLKIIQNEKGFCFGIDSVLISDFAKEIKKDSYGVDLGTGTGIISILLTAKTELRKIFGLEIQEEVANMAERSVILNKMQDKIEILNINIKDILKSTENSKKDNNVTNKLQRESFDFVVTNPPYKKIETGKINENEYKYISRHEIKADLEDFIRVSKYLLKDKGSLYMVHRPDRLADIMELMREYKLEPKKLRLVYPSKDKEPTLVLIKGVKNSRPFLKVEKPLIIYNENNEYTEEIYEIYNKKK